MQRRSRSREGTVGGRALIISLVPFRTQSSSRASVCPVTPGALQATAHHPLSYYDCLGGEGPGRGGQSPRESQMALQEEDGEGSGRKSREPQRATNTPGL